MKIYRYRDRAGEVRHAGAAADGSRRRLEGDPFGAYRLTDEVADIARLLAPVAPTGIFGIGLNYRRHAEETNARIPTHPVVFMKGLNAVQDPGAPILLPQHLASDEVDYEGELAVVIGRACKNVAPERALEHVLGYTCANDVSARDWQKRHGGGQWCRGKTFDTFAPLGPCLVTADEIGDPNDLTLRTVVSGEVRQTSSTRDMIFTVPELIAFLSGSTTLLPGTVILTGTPHGVGMAAVPPRWLRAGDTVAVEIERIGTLENPVALEP